MTSHSGGVYSRTGIFLCTCQRKKDAAAWGEKVAQSLARHLPDMLVFPHNALCAAAGIKFAAARMKQRKLDKALLAGCKALQSEAYCARLAARAGIPMRSVESIRLAAGASAADAARAIRRAAAGSALPPVETRRVDLGQDALVVGGGRAGWETARLLAGLGHPIAVALKGIQPAFGPIPGATILSNTTLVSLTGSTGHFSARLSHEDAAGPAGTNVREFGAVVIEDPNEHAENLKAESGDRVVPLAELENTLKALPRGRRPPCVVIVLDYRIDEGTAGFEAALRAAIGARDRFHAQVEILLRDARVAGYGLEVQYDIARERCVRFAKHDGRLEISARESAPGTCVRYRDAALGQDVEILCDIAAVSEDGLSPVRDDLLAATAGIGQDGYGRLGENNVHLLPIQTNRQGVFVVSPGREKDAALSVHALLSQRTLPVELSQAVVDAEKCALCLTCIRLCPFKAMRIDETEQKAECIPESCRACGICAAECPARAITIPAWSDDILTAKAGASR
jgi:heterodisulfide reductase subunit A-like polyferredoxin